MTKATELPLTERMSGDERTIVVQGAELKLGAVSDLSPPQRLSLNGFAFLEAGDVTQGQPQLDRLYNTNGSTATLAKWMALGLSGSLPAGDYTVTIRPHVNTRWKLRNRALFFNAATPSLANLNSTVGASNVQVQTYSYTAPANTWHAFNAQWTDAGTSPTASDVAELLAGLSISLDSTGDIGEEAGRFLAPGGFGESDNLEGDVIVSWPDDYLYVRVRRGWNATTDRLQRYLLGHTGNFTTIGQADQGNGVIDFVGEKLVPTTWPKNTPLETIWAAASNGSIEVRAGGDEAAPLRLGGNLMFVGGGHGYVCRLATVTGEAVTFSHIGKRYTDGAALEYVVNWVDTATGQMKLFPKPTGTTEGWTHTNGVISGGTLTPVGGGTTLTVTADASSQAWPVPANYSYTARFNDGRLIAKGMPLRSGSEVVLSESYGIPNFRQLYDDLVALEGTFTENPDFGAVGTLIQVDKANSWIIDHIGVPRRPHTVTFNQAGTASMHAAQTMKPSLTNGATSLIAYVPGTGVLNGLDFETGADLTSNAIEQSFVRSVWDDPAVPPDSVVLLARLGAVTKHGVVNSISQTVAGGVPVTRDGRIGASGRAAWISSAEKIYIEPLSIFAATAGLVVGTLVIAGAVNPEDFGDADFAFAWREGGKLRIRAYRAAALTNGLVPVPTRYVSEPVGLAATKGTASLPEGMASADGIRVTWGAARSEIELVVG